VKHFGLYKFKKNIKEFSDPLVNENINRIRDDADECLADITKNDISEMSIRTWDDDYQVGNWYINGKRDDTDQEEEPLNTGNYKSNYAWVF